MDYTQKENYVTVNPEPDSWRTHANFHIMSFYSVFIKGTIADLGCNQGACTLLLLDWVDQIESIYGLDINFEALKVAFQTANEMNPPKPVNFMAANLLEIPLEDNKFDFMMSFHTLEHIYPEDAPQFAKEVHRLLKPGGIFLLSIPYDKAYPDPAHVAFYNVETLTQLFENAGLYTVEATKDNRWQEKDLLTALFTKLPPEQSLAPHEKLQESLKS